MKALEVKQLKKSFGNQVILKDVSFQVKKGRTLGFIGKNGAGKTTTMKIVTGLMKSDQGDIFLEGEQIPSSIGYKGIPIGYLPDVPIFYPYMKPIEYLQLCGEIMGEKPEIIKKRSNELLTLVGLKGINKRIGTFSRGMKQRLGMAQALMGNPKLLLCDEPTSALDPIGRREILELISQIKEHTTVVFSTHVLTDVEQVCDDVAILNEGRILYCGDMEELKTEHGSTKLNLKFCSVVKAQEFSEKLSSILPNLSVTLDELQLTILLPVNMAEQEPIVQRIWDILRENKIILNSYFMQNPTLEQVFMEMIK